MSMFSFYSFTDLNHKHCCHFVMNQLLIHSNNFGVVQIHFTALLIWQDGRLIYFPSGIFSVCTFIFLQTVPGLIWTELALLCNKGQKGKPTRLKFNLPQWDLKSTKWFVFISAFWFGIYVLYLNSHGQCCSGIISFFLKQTWLHRSELKNSTFHLLLALSRPLVGWSKNHISAVFVDRLAIVEARLILLCMTQSLPGLRRGRDA